MKHTTPDFLCARKVARPPRAVVLCAVFVALVALAGCQSGQMAEHPAQPSPTATITPTSTPTHTLRSGGILLAGAPDAALPTQATYTPTPLWTETSGGPVPPLAPARKADFPKSTPEPVSVLVQNAGFPKVAPLYKGASAESVNGAPPLPDIELPQTLANIWAETENYLVMGTDRQANASGWRTDTLMVVGLDRANGRAAILSIPRDIYVDIPGYGWGRINQIDGIGEQRGDGEGPHLLGSVIETYLGIPTHHWIRVHMDGFIPVVDALGGINITLDTPFYDMWQSADGTRRKEMYLPAGEHHLTGEEAYYFTRLRYVGSDIGRASRQRAVIWALREKLMQGDTLLRLPELYAAFQQYVSTDLTIVEMLSLAQVAITLGQDDVRSGGIGLADLRSYVTTSGAQVLLMDNPWHVRGVVEGVWSDDAPTLADSFRGNAPGTVVEPSTPTAEVTTTLPITTSAVIIDSTVITESTQEESTPAATESPADVPTEAPTETADEAATEEPARVPTEIPTATPEAQQTEAAPERIPS